MEKPQAAYETSVPPPPRSLRFEEKIPPAAEPLSCGPTPAFGRHFVPGMLLCDYKDGEGWVHGRIERRGAISLDPSCIGINYGQSVFEGLKAYRQPDGSVALFRVRDHALRLERSARRVALPEVSADMIVDALVQFVRHQARAIPEGPEVALYLRPLLIGTEAGLGIRASKDALLLVVGAV